MTDDLTDVLERAAGPVPPAPALAVLLRAGRRRRRGRRAAAGATVVAGLAVAVALAGSLPSAQPRIAPLATDAAVTLLPGIVQATDGAVPALPVDAAPIDVDLRPLGGLGPEVRAAAVAADGRVAVSTTGRDLHLARPAGPAATSLVVPTAIDRCGSMAFDADGSLWALCHVGATTPMTTLLLRYTSDDVEPTRFDVTELIRSASPTAGFASLWVDGAEVRAVVPTDVPADTGQPPNEVTWVTLVSDGEQQVVADAPTEDLTLLATEPTGSLSASAGWLVATDTTPAGRQLRIAWLGNETAATIGMPPDEPWGAEGGGAPSAFVGDAITATLELSSTDRTVVYGVASDGRGTTSVMELPTSATGMADLPDRPTPRPPVTMLLPAPDGSVHLLSAGTDSLSVGQVLPADE